MKISFDEPKLRATTRRLRGLGPKSSEAAKKSARITALRYRERVIKYSSGRPGPRRVTGAYHDSIHTRQETTRTSVTVSVFTDAPQARRLELGFVGMDSLGRMYNQKPLPHWRPAKEGMREYMADEGKKEMRKAIREA